MQKDFDGWNKKKKRVETRLGNPYYGVRELWWSWLGINVGTEQNGTGKNFARPVLILKGLGKGTCLVVPLTTSLRNHTYRLYIGEVEGKQARALLSQIRVIDTKRLIRKIGMLNEVVFAEIRKAAKDML